MPIPVSRSVKTVLLFGVAASVMLTGCNKLGYSEIRTAPDGQAMLGAKRVPHFNQLEMQKRTANRGNMPQQARGQQMPPQQPPMGHYQRPVVAHMPANMMAPMPPHAMPTQPVAVMVPPPTAVPVVTQPPVAEAPVTPYGRGAQSYQPAGQNAPVMEPMPPAAQSDQQSSYHLPREYPAGSYYNAGHIPAAGHQDFVQNVSMTDYYAQDIQQQPVAAAPMPQPAMNNAHPMSQAEQIYQETMASQNAQQWMAQAAPIPQVQGQNLPVAQIGSFNAGYGMEAAYGRYQESPLAVMPQNTASHYQPMTSNNAASLPAIDPYAPQAIEPAYNHPYYGGQSMAQPQMQQMQQPQQPQQMPAQLNHISQQQYIEDTLRKPLEEPPMLLRDSMMPTPNTHAMPSYGDGGYR